MMLAASVKIIYIWQQDRNLPKNSLLAVNLLSEKRAVVINKIS